jgi:hypothetical protein
MLYNIFFEKNENENQDVVCSLPNQCKRQEILVGITVKAKKKRTITGYFHKKS